jgi:hypothetical protein
LERWRALVHAEPNGYARTGWLGQRFVINLLSGNPEVFVWTDSLLRQPGGLTREMLRIYPGFAPLRSDPRYRRLVDEGAEPGASAPTGGKPDR